MHKRIKALIVAAMVATNSVSPTLEVLANELELDKVSEEITTTIITEEESGENITLDTEEKEEENSPLDTKEEKQESNTLQSEEKEVTNTLNKEEKSEVTNTLNVEEKIEQDKQISTKAVNKLEIKPNTGEFDWGYGNSNQVAILVDFDNTTNKKVLEIELIEGMVFDKYLVIDEPANEVEYKATKDDLSLIKEVLEKPTKDPITGQYSGKLVYQLQEGVASGKIVINVSVDRYRYYAAKEIINAIKVSVKENDGKPVLTAESVQSKDNTTVGAKNNSLKLNSTGRTAELQPGGEGETYSYYRNTTSNVQTGDNGIRDFTYIKGAELIMYYPMNTTLVSVNNLPDGAKYDNYPLENKVVITIPGPTIKNSNISLTYKVNNNAPFETLYSPNKNTMKVEYYDGATGVLTADKVDSIIVVNPDDIDPFITMKVHSGYYHDYAGESLSIGGYIHLENKTVKEYNEQVFEYVFSNWNTRKVLLPYGMTGIKNIKYKLFGNETEYSIDNNKLVNFDNVQRLVDADELEIPEGKYFEKVTFEVENIPVGLDYTEKGRYNIQAISFGELPKDVTEGSTRVEIYPKGKKHEKHFDEIIPIKKADKTEKIAISSGETILKDENGNKISTAFNQNVLKASASFDANKGFSRLYDLSNYLENPEIIIRMPKGFHLSIGTIKLTQKGVKKEYDIKEHSSNLDGAKIYTLQTKDVKIGGFDRKTLEVSPSINIEFDFATDSTVDGKYNLNNMIFIGKKGACIDEVYAGSGLVVQTDKFDLIQGDQLDGKDRWLGRTQTKELEIRQVKELVVTTHIRDKGSSEDKQPYNKDDESTAIQVSKGTLIDYIVKIQNNHDKNNAEEFELYIPIPKKGVNMGETLQIEEFNWDMELEGNVVISAIDASGNSLSDLFEVSYGSSKDKGAVFDKNYSEDKDIIRVVTKSGMVIKPGVKGEIKFTFKVSDNAEQSDVGSLNVFNAYYRRKYDSSDVRLKGNYVGLRLAIGQVKGIAFLDNDRDGLFNKDIDTVLEKVSVKLFDKSTGSKIADTETNSDGEYKFEGLGNGDYEIKVAINSGEDKRFTKLTALSGDSYKNDSDIESTDNVNGSISVSIPTNKLNIHDMNDYINVGFVEPVNITIAAGEGGKVSGSNSYSYKVWPFTEIQDPGIVTSNTGYKFVNYTNSDGDIFEFGSEVNSDIEITANFEKIRYQIHLNPNDGVAGAENKIDITFGDNIATVLKNSLTDDHIPTREGYKFVGWSTSTDANDLIKENDTNTMGSASITLYAIWDKAPEINGVSDIKITARPSFDLLEGITATDIEDGNVTITVDEGDFKSYVSGVYEVKYTVEDKAGNITTVIRKITVDEAPVISGASDITITARPSFDLLEGVTVTDKEDQNLTITVDKGDFKSDVSGVYQVKYTVEDTAGNIITVIREITVDEAPIINGASDIKITARPSFDLLEGVEVIDKEEQGLTINVDKGNFNPELSGVYEVKYTVEDKAGNITTVIRKITVDEAPVISGASDITITARPSFDLLEGVTVTDKEEQGLTITVDEGDFKSDVSGVYEVKYTVEDKAGNRTTVIRKITVDEAPVISGASDIKITARPNFDLLEGVEVIDKEEQGLTINVEKGNFNSEVSGVYEVKYTVEDKAGNITTLIRKITVDEAPVISGASDIIITARPSFDLLEGVTVTDKEEQGLTITVDEGDFKSDVSGVYEVKYTVEDTAGNITTLIRKITVDEAPVINGASDITITARPNFDLLEGVTVTDKEDQNLTITVDEGDFKSDVSGVYEVKYTVEDTAGNIITVIRKITVDEAPVIKGVVDTTIKVGDEFNPLTGITVEDDEEQDLEIKVSGDEVLVNVSGRYEVIYTVTDKAGNVTTEKRIVIVYGTPVITGVDNLVIKVNDTFNELENVFAEDTEGNPLEVKVIENTVDVKTPGKYKVVYEAIDIVGNTVRVERIITVEQSSDTNVDDDKEEGKPGVDVEGEKPETDEGNGNEEEKPDTDENNGNEQEKPGVDVEEEKPDTDDEGVDFDPMDCVTEEDTENEGSNSDTNVDVEIEKPNTDAENEQEKPGTNVENEQDKTDTDVNTDKEENKTDLGSNINTGDTGITSNLLLAILSMIGLVKSRKKKK